MSLDLENLTPEDRPSFQHKGIKFDPESYKIEFNKEAKRLLWEKIQEIQRHLPEINKSIELT